MKTIAKEFNARVKTNHDKFCTGIICKDYKARELPFLQIYGFEFNEQTRVRVEVEYEDGNPFVNAECFIISESGDVVGKGYEDVWKMLDFMRENK